MNQVSICESLLKRNEIETFLKRMITGDEQWIMYDNNVRKRWWSKPGVASQMVAKPVLTPKKVITRKKTSLGESLVFFYAGCWVFGGIGKELFIMNCSNLAEPLIRLSTVNN